MSNVIAFKKPSLKEKHKGKTLCKHGFHKWAVLSSSQFDVKQGRLVTSFKCLRCSEKKIELR